MKRWAISPWPVEYRPPLLILDEMPLNGVAFHAGGTYKFGYIWTREDRPDPRAQKRRPVPLQTQ